MPDLRRISLTAVVLLVVLRLSIGWQLLYEGMWKIDTLHTAKPWSSAGYLKNSVGPMRDTFRKMAGDPDELGWLDYETMKGRWTSWADRFSSHYRLDERQQKSLNELLNGRTVTVNDKTVFAQDLAELPDSITDLKKDTRVSDRVIWYDAGRKKLFVDANQIMTPSDKARLESVIKAPPEGEKPDPKDVAYLKAVNTMFERQKKGLGYLRRLAGALKGDPDLLGNQDWQRVGKLEEYKNKLDEYERNYAVASTSYQHDHLQYTWRQLQSLRSELTGPIKSMDADLKDAAYKLLTLEQRGRGPAPEPVTMLKFADTMTIIGLTVLGTLLIAGLFTRFAAVAAAFMLFNFYLAMPPLPGVPDIPGPEHSFIINKNLIEVFALAALASLPTGRWFGLDAVMARFFSNWKADKRKSSQLKSTVSAGGESADTPEAAPATA